jgi:hypothetical protein
MMGLDTEFEAVILSKVTKKYVIWMTQGQSGLPIKDCATLEEALTFVKENEGEGSFAIVYPNGEFHKWD